MDPVNPHSTESRLVIIVEDVNDNSPDIVVTFLEPDSEENTGM